MTTANPVWWKDGTCYQIYPASFKDSNDDGLGDIPGIVSKVDYLKDLGVDIVWLSPMYESPQVDMGYDISNYEEVHAPYGTVQDVETLIKACHDRGMRFILDLVVNHTSIEHAWFKESRSSKTNPKRDWYIWRPARYDKDGKRMPPNNWRSWFSGSAWEWDPTTEEYYLRLFAAEQPDLNWENPTTRHAIYDSAMRFWLEKGVDGFRIDTVNMYSKGTEMPDAEIVDPGSFVQPSGHMFCNGPRMHEFLREMNTEVLDHYDTMTVGELPVTPDPAHVLRYIGSRDKQLNMIFQFDVVDLGTGMPNKYDFIGFKRSEFKKIITKWQKFIENTDGWTTAFCENHDQGRSVTRFASDAPEHRVASAKLLAMLMGTMSGTLFLYQGQEIGMTNIPPGWPIEDFLDLESLNYYNTVKKRTNGDPAALAKVMTGIHQVGRDNARVPMQWDDSEWAGFSGVKPWMRVHDAYKEINVAAQEKDEGSALNFWKRMLKLRKEYRELFVHGIFNPFDLDDENTFIFLKEFGNQRSLTVLNFSDAEQPFVKPAEMQGKLELLVGNFEGGEQEILRPWEGRVYLVS